MKTIDDIIMEQLPPLPPLPEGWTYVFNLERVYEGELKVQKYVMTATPVQLVKAGGGVGGQNLSSDDRSKPRPQSRRRAVEIGGL